MIGSSLNCKNLTGDGPRLMRQHTFNPKAEPFVYPFKPADLLMAAGDNATDTSRKETTASKLPAEEVAYIGPTHLPVNKRVWSSISNYSLKEIDRTHPLPARHVHSQLYPKIYPGANGLLKGCSDPAAHHPSCPANKPMFGPVLLPSGVIQLNLRDGIIVKMTLNSVKVINQRKSIAIAMSGNASATAMRHPNGVVFQNGAQVDIVASDAKKSNNFIRYAKMWHKGISFTSNRCALIYLVDSAGTRTTSDMITMDLESDYVNQVFFNGAACSVQTMAELNLVMRRSSYHLENDGSLVYQINDYRITQGSDGLLKLSNPRNQCSIRTSPSNGSATLTTPHIHCTASLGATSHLFVRREERRMHFDGAVFIVRNAGHSAGFDESNRLRVY